MNVVSNVRWVSVSQGMKIVTQLASVAVLARLLPPESYGTLAMAMAVINFANLFRDFGLQTTLIRHPVVSDDMKDTVHRSCVVLGPLLAVLLIIAAVPISRGFGQPDLVPVICALAFMFPISTLSLVHQALLERAGNFRTLARIEATSGVTALVVAILLALAGAEVWALVAQMLLNAALITIQLRLNSEWRPRNLFSREEFRAIWSMGADLSAFRVMTYFENNLDSIIIGRVLGAGPLGIYAMALKVILFPLQNMSAVLCRALLPVMSQHQSTPEALGPLYLRSLAMTVMITAPLAAGLFMLREPFVAVVFGPKWLEMVGILQWLALVFFIQSISNATGIVFLARGQSRLLLWLGVLGAVLFSSSFIIGVQWGIEGVAFCYFIANLINLWPCLLLSLRSAHVPVRQLLTEITPALVSSIFMALVLWQAEPLMSEAWPLGVRFTAMVILGAAAYASCFLLMRPDLTALRAFIKVPRPQ